MIRYNCFYSIVVAACEVAKVQQAMLDRGWTPPPEEPVRYTDGIEPPQPPRGKWVAITHLYQHDDNLSMSVELGSPGTWEWFLRDERCDHWIVARGTAASCAKAMHDVVCALVKYEAKLAREQAIMWDANHDCREKR
jgi:hypothetical protein